MKSIYRGTAIIAILFIVISCSFSRKQTTGRVETDDLPQLEIIVPDPGHLHASLLQKEELTDVSGTIRIYVPEGTSVNQYLENIDSYDQRAKSPTTRKKQIYTGDDYLQKMLTDHKDNVVVLAGNNQRKMRYIMESIKTGYRVLADKPLAVNPQNFRLLTEAYQLAKERNLLLYSLMTKRYDILNIIEKELLHQMELFGDLQKGSPDNPSVIMESVHRFFRTVSGKPSIRLTWYYDVEQQEEGTADVTTHLIDPVNWRYFSDETIHYQSGVTVNTAKHWPTPVTLTEFSQSIQTNSFPAYLNRYIKNDILGVMTNGGLNYTIKGICIEMRVTWNYTPPINGGDTSTSIKKGSKVTLEIVQDGENGFVRELYTQKGPDISNRTFEAQLQKAVEQLQITYPFLPVRSRENGTYLIGIPQEKRLGHGEHFSKMAKAFLRYVDSKDIPEWENENTLAKYYITTTAVEMVRIRNK